MTEANEMNDKVLTDEEKNALVEGVESGEIEVQSSSGPTYASVTAFRIPARAHIVKNGYPRLKLLNQQVAERIARDVEQLLQRDVTVNASELVVNSYVRVCERLPDLVAAIVFEAAPLQGQGLITLESSMVRLLVDTFFGGDGVDSEIYPVNSFTTGELSVSNLFASIVLSAIRDSWAPLQEIVAERVTTEVSIDLVDIVTESDLVICTEFEISLSDRQCLFQVLLPIEMLQPLLPVFDGQKGDRDPVDDARWAKAIQRRVVESRVNLTSNVFLPEMTLGELVELGPGDVIEIEQPQQATVMAKNVQLINGRLGVHRGRNAVEAIEWVDPLQAELTEMRT
jgi:flagellar motor switch protein FliM